MTILNNEEGNPNLRIGFEQTSEVICDECRNVTFKEVVFLRKASALITGAPKDSYIPIPTFACVKCGNVNDEFVPDQLKSPLVTS